MYNLFKKIAIVFIALLSFLGILTIDAISENIIVNNLLMDFMEKGVFKETKNNFHLYEVIIDQKLDSPSITFSSNGSPRVGTKGDIFVHPESVMDILPFSAEFITFYFGGHAGIVIDENSVYETTGMEANMDNNVVIEGRNKILYEYYDRSAVGLRVIATNDEIDKAMNYAESTIGKKYNYSFVFNRKETYYCTDLVARSFSKEAGLSFSLDTDGIAVSCNDLIISDDTFITYYLHYHDGEKHLYYAVNE